MRSSAVLALLGATFAIASPVHQAIHKKALVTSIETEIVYVTVTAGDLPATTSVPAVPTTVVVKHTVFAHRTRKTKTKASSTTPPPPPPTTSTPAPEPTTVAPVVVPTTSEAPVVVVPTTTAAPVVVPTTEAAPIVVSTSTPVVKAEQVATPAVVEASKPTDYKSTALYHHKMHRANHTANELAWDDTLAGYAKTIANTCVFAHDMAQGGGGYGQNLAAYGTTADMSKMDLSTLVADAITNQWYYGETANMPYGQDSPAVTGVPEFLHLSQVLWKATTHVGCFTAQCGAGTIFSYHSLYTVCNYKSVGNVLGSFSSQVTKPIGLAGITAKIA